MRFLAGIRNEDDRAAAEKALAGGKSPDMVKTAIKGGGPILPAKPLREEDVKARLEKEKIRLKHTIANLSRRLDEIERELGEL
jgi:hypothetical protein